MIGPKQYPERKNQNGSVLLCKYKSFLLTGKISCFFYPPQVISPILQAGFRHMIQRIQTLFLAGVAGISLALYYLPLYSYAMSGGEGVHEFFIMENVFLSVLNGVVLLLSVMAIFFFKNRNLQVRITSLNMLLVSILIVSDFYFSDRPVTLDASLHFEVGSYLLLLSLVLLWLAVRFIRKDEQLVRSADRLR